MAFTEFKSVEGLGDPLIISYFFFSYAWVATPLFYVRYMRQVGIIEQASAIDKSAISANNGRQSRGLIGRLAQQGAGNRRAPEIYNE
jgi:hypothetical protein